MEMRFEPPPPIHPLVAFANPAGFVLATERSPKSAALPVL